jgi:hypothetical protein
MRLELDGPLVLAKLQRRVQTFSANLIDIVWIFSAVGLGAG